MGRTGRCVALAGVALACIPAVSWATDFSVPTPADAATVAGPVSGARLVAFDHEGDLCLDVLRTGEPRKYTQASCGAPPALLSDALFQEEGGPRRVWRYAAVPPQVAAVELVTRGGRVFRAPTTAGAGYHGVASGHVRFALVARPQRPRLRLTRLLDATGKVIYASEDQFGPDEGRPPKGAKVLGHGRRAGSEWRTYAYRDRRLAPTPLEPERYDPYLCVSVHRLPHLGTSSGQCVLERWGLQGGPLAVEPEGDCSGYQIAGLAAARIRTVVLVMGDGSRVRLLTRRLPFAGTRLRGFGLATGPDEAVRRMLAFDERGRGVAQDDLGLDPADAQCDPEEDSGTGFGFAFGAFGGGFGHRHVLAGDPPLVARDDGDYLCVAPGRLLPRHADCTLPPQELFSTRLMTARGGGRTLFAGLVAPEVTGVRVTLDGGERRTLIPGPDPAYHGKYAGVVRFVSLALPGSRSVISARLLTAERSYRWYVYGVVEPKPVSVTLAHIGGLRLTARDQAGVFGGRDVCVSVTGSYCVDARSVSVRASCHGGLVLLGVVPHQVRRIVAVLADGRHARAAFVRPPRSFPKRPRVWYLAVGRLAGTRRLFAVGRNGASVTVRLPAAAQQCGYRGFFPWSRPVFIDGVGLTDFSRR